MPTKTNLPSTNHYIHLNSVAAKNAFINCSVYIIFFLGLTLCQDLLPFDLTIVGLITVIQVLICVFHAVSVEKSGYKTPVFLYLFSIIILNLSEFNRLLCEYANLEFMIYISMIVIISIPYCHVVYQQKWQTFLNGSENQPQLTALLKSLMLNRNRENHNAPIPALDFTKQKRPFSKH
jgi:hypothetical protein